MWINGPQIPNSYPRQFATCGYGACSRSWKQCAQIQDCRQKKNAVQWNNGKWGLDVLVVARGFVGSMLVP